jgi:3-hydroxyisobutyrate dehydrogenase-like beta-hydroxyacid dehydrogenase
VSTSAASKKIGLIGLGLMGRPMGLNLRKAGYPLTVWNRTRARAEELVAAGAVLAKTPREVAEASDVLLTIVSDPPALESVLWGTDGNKEGALGALKSGAIYIDSSTISPTLVKKISAACQKNGVRFLDAPVTGGDWGAREGNLVFMIGGDAETLREVQPILNVMGKKFFHLGGNGAGQTIKLAINAILALEVGAVAEAIGLVTKAGLAGEQLLEVLQSSMGRSGLLDLKTPLMLTGDFRPSFPLRLMHKDLGLALDLANQLGVALPTTAAVREVYNHVKAEAKQDVDYSAVVQFYKK